MKQSNTVRLDESLGVLYLISLETDVFQHHVSVMAAVRCDEYSATAGTQVCHYGTQPGYWIPADNETYTWQLYDERCQLQDLLTQRLKVQPLHHHVILHVSPV